MMNSKQFQSLDSEIQSQVLWLDGVFLNLTRRHGNVIVDLYALYDFYVEIYFEETTDEPLYLSAFTDTGRLDPYLSQVMIDELVH
ncbi:MAG TPA: hypothetical protein VFZ78_13495 [Flavisolibacter sp.]